MTDVDTSQLPGLIESFNTSARDVLETHDPAAMERVEAQLSEIEGYVRELQQAMWVDEAEETLQRLEQNEPLLPIDKDVIRTFMVADAEHYLANENSYGEWVRELQRLMKDLSHRTHVVDRDSIGDLRGVLKDAIRLLPDIRHYFEERRRVARFDLAVDELDDKTRKMLVRIIREQLFSPAR